MVRSRILLVLCAAAAMAAPHGAWAADLICQFRAKGLSLAFGTLDPSSNLSVTKPVVASTTFADMAGDCQGGNMTIAIQGGATSRQLVKGADTIDYTISGLPITLARPGNAPGGNPAAGYTTWFAAGQIQATIAWSAYADKPAGLYTDTITVVVTP
jgi:hypothetical protein